MADKSFVTDTATAWNGMMAVILQFLCLNSQFYKSIKNV